MSGSRSTGWKSVGVVIKREQADLAPLLERILAILRSEKLDVVLDREAAALVSAPDSAPLPELAAQVDVLIALGGDGTMLAAARAIGERNVPILGINLGRLGFLTDLAPGQVETALPAILRGDFTVSERSRLSVTKDSALVGAVLNDAVLTSEVARLIELETRVEDRLVARYRADGLIVSTPTGSTAYNLSAGGPLLDPGVAAMILTPICPHTLTQRPLVLPDSFNVEVRLCSDEPIRLTLDGQTESTLAPGDSIRVTRSPHAVRFISADGHDPFETLRTKLGWASR